MALKQTIVAFLPGQQEAFVAVAKSKGLSMTALLRLVVADYLKAEARQEATLSERGQGVSAGRAGRARGSRVRHSPVR